MRIYMGFRLGGLCYVYVWDAQMPGRPRKLDPRLDLGDHSPTGFEWGFVGSGPTQLALALCADALCDGARAQRVYQLAKRQLLARMHRDCWSMTADSVCAIVREIEEQHGGDTATALDLNNQKEDSET